MGRQCLPSSLIASPPPLGLQSPAGKNHESLAVLPRRCSSSCSAIGGTGERHMPPLTLITGWEEPQLFLPTTGSFLGENRQVLLQEVVHSMAHRGSVHSLARRAGEQCILGRCVGGLRAISAPMANCAHCSCPPMPHPRYATVLQQSRC